MFAGIGYFSLPIGKHSNPEKIYSIELNPVSYTFLEKNIKLNHLEEKIVDNITATFGPSGARCKGPNTPAPAIKKPSVTVTTCVASVQ